MKDDRLRVPVDDPYVMALGRVAYVFATMEWNAVWCCDKMNPNYAKRASKKKSSTIATDLTTYAKRRPNPQLRNDCLNAATEFKRLVLVRNNVAHGKPGTASDGEQRLFHEGRPWTIEMLQDTADEYAACSLVLSDLFHHRL
jgi:hypothetical protein